MNVPTICPYRHPLNIPGAVRVGWTPCLCPTGRLNFHGHTTITCEECHRRGWTTKMFQPEHIRTSDEVEDGLRWVRDNLARSEEGLAELRASGADGWRRVRLEDTVVRLERTVVEGERVIEARRAVEQARGQKTARHP
jgi:hypothetical protein